MKIKQIGLGIVVLAMLLFETTSKAQDDRLRRRHSFSGRQRVGQIFDISDPKINPKGDYSELDFSNQGLHSLVGFSRLFSSDVKPQVEKIFLNSNDLTRIEGFDPDNPGRTYFQGYYNLQELHLEHNQIYAIDEGAFSALNIPRTPKVRIYLTENPSITSGMAFRLTKEYPHIEFFFPYDIKRMVQKALEFERERDRERSLERARELAREWAARSGQPMDIERAIVEEAAMPIEVK